MFLTVVLLMPVAIIVFIKIKFHFCHKLLISAWKRGRFQYLLTGEEGFVSVGSSLVQPWWEPQKYFIPSPFICSWLCPALAAAGSAFHRHLGQKPTSVWVMFYLLFCQGWD